MKKIFVITTITCATVFAISCSPKIAKTSGGEQVAFDETKYKEADFAKGQTIMESSCNRCHKLFDPGKFGKEKWTRVLNRKIPKAKLSIEDGNLVRAYVFKNAKVE